ncbi:uncharacterized protein LOC144124441 [Amblyomma americanum]
MDFKAPLQAATFNFQKQTMLQLSTKLMSLRLPSLELVCISGRRMSVISLAFSLKSIAELAQKLFDSTVCSYICTYRFSQDHLEMFFSCIRQRGGWNNNPSALQFRYAYRSLLVHADVLPVTTGNVTPDFEGIATVAHGRLHRSNDDEAGESPDMYIAIAITDHDYSSLGYGLTNFSLGYGLTNFSTEVVTYIGGFIVRVVSKSVNCTSCLEMLVQDDIASVLIFIRNNGGLIMPSALVIHTLCTAEHIFRCSDEQGHKNVDRLVIQSFQKFCQRHEQSLKEVEHYKENPAHVIGVIKFVLKKYVTLRLTEEARRIIERARGAYVRALLTKQILFQHQ